MKITELILQLHQEMLARGNVDVWLAGYSIGEPKVEWFDGPPAGIYLN